MNICISKFQLQLLLLLVSYSMSLLLISKIILITHNRDCNHEI